METKLKDLANELKEDRKIREKRADWKFIKKQPYRIKKALELFVMTGDMYKASRIAGITLDEMNQLRMKSRIPIVI